MTTDEYHALIAAGVIAPVELVDGRVWMGEHLLAFSASQLAAAERLGIDLPSQQPDRLALTADGLRGAAADCAADPDDVAEKRRVREDPRADRGSDDSTVYLLLVGRWGVAEDVVGVYSSRARAEAAAALSGPWPRGGRKPVVEQWTVDADPPPT